jgi:hypothetical protein
VGYITLARSKSKSRFRCCGLSWRHDVDDVLSVLAAPCCACALRKAARCSMAIADSGRDLHRPTLGHLAQTENVTARSTPNSTRRTPKSVDTQASRTARTPLDKGGGRKRRHLGVQQEGVERADEPLRGPFAHGSCVAATASKRSHVVVSRLRDQPKLAVRRGFRLHRHRNYSSTATKPDGRDLGIRRPVTFSADRRGGEYGVEFAVR